MIKKCKNLNELLNCKDNFDIDEVTALALSDKSVLEKLLEGLKVKTETVRFNCEKVLLQISEDQPSIIYPEWDYFISLLDSKNSFHRCCALNLIANLSQNDPQKKFEKIFDKYFSYLNDVKLIPAVFVARNAGKIMKSKNKLQNKIIKILLEIDQTDRDPERIDLIKADIIQSFDQIYDECKEKKKILTFVEKQCDCKSPKTRKVAEEFLQKYHKNSGSERGK